MSKLLNVLSSLYVRDHKITHSIILDVTVAMLPITTFGAYHFSIHTPLVFIVMVAARAPGEYVHKKPMKKLSTISDRNVLVTGLILALNMPPEIPVWVPALGGIFAIIVAKQPYGGLGQNFINLAPAARCFLLISFAGRMINLSYSGFDDVSSATPLVVFKSGGAVDTPAMFMGDIPGTIGEASVIALLVGAVYLLAKKVISIRILGIYILTVVVFAILFGDHGFDSNYIAAHLCGSGLIFGAFFTATDYVTSPITPKGQIVFGILLGVFTGLFRIFDSSAGGVSRVIIINNILAPLIEKVALPKAFGKKGK